MSQTKGISVFLLSFILLSSACFSENNQPLEIAFDYVPGEIFVRLLPGYSQKDLEDIVEDFEVTINRTLGNGYIINVPVDFEPLWITQFSSVPIITESSYNRFGYDYSITLEEPEPIVNDNTLTLTINYTGCEGGHAFSLERPGQFSNNLVIWLLKTTPDEPCDMAISEEYSFTLERFIQISEQVSIEDPYGNLFLLWPEPEEPVED